MLVNLTQQSERSAREQAERSGFSDVESYLAHLIAKDRKVSGFLGDCFVSSPDELRAALKKGLMSPVVDSPEDEMEEILNQYA